MLSSLIIFVVKNVKYNWHEASRDSGKKLIKLRSQDEKNARERMESEDKKKLDDNFIVIMPSYKFDDEKNAYVEEFK